MNGPDQFLSEYYGTNADLEEAPATDDELEKMAQLTLLTKEAAEQGVDLSQYTEEEILEAAAELYGGGQAFEKVAADQNASAWEEYDYGGRIMAHAFWQESDLIAKEASLREEIASRALNLRRKAADITRGIGRAFGGGDMAAAKRRIFNKRFALSEAERALGAKAQQALAAGKERKAHRLVQKAMKQTGKLNRLGLGDSVVNEMRAGELRRGLGVAGGAAGLTGLVGAAGYTAGRSKRSADSAFEQVVAERAYDLLNDAGYDADHFFGLGQEKTAADEFDATVDRAALEFLEANGVPVSWNE